jgi:hypothetical protein
LQVWIDIQTPIKHLSGVLVAVYKLAIDSVSSSGVGKGSVGKLDGRPSSLKRYSRPLLSCIEFVQLRMLLFVFSIPSGTEKLVE